MATAAAAAKSLQSCPTVCDPIDSSPPGSPVPGILQAKIQEWVAISFSNVWKWKVKVKSLSHVRLLADSYFPMDERLLHLPGQGWDEVHVVTHTLGHAGLQPPLHLKLNSPHLLNLWLCHCNTECTGPGGSGTSPTRWSPGPGLEPEMHGSAQCTGALATWTPGCLCNSRHCTRTWGPPSFGYFPSVDTSPWNPLPPAPRAAAAPPWQPVQFLAAPAPTWTPVHRLDLLICNFYFFFFFLTWLF